MKRSLSFIALLVSISILLSSCNSDIQILNYNSNEYVDLFDYKNIEVPIGYLELENEDIEQIILVELSSNEIYFPVKDRTFVVNDDIILLEIEEEQFYYFVGTNSLSKDFDEKVIRAEIGDFIDSENELRIFSARLLGIYRNVKIDDEDFILDYYGYSNNQELFKFLEKRAQNEIYYNYVIQEIEKKSIIKSIPNEIDLAVKKDIKELEKELKSSNKKFDDYLKDNNLTEEELYNDLLYYYKQCMLFKAVLDNENLTISNKEIREVRENSNLSSYDSYLNIAEQKLKDVITIT
ncbi:MAG: hypothetical protein NC213_09385 [Acetobacter sp.]|nr:hypothetical protein [Bacteroides sp.]MCM1341943.1 hypothetical protein [Acetobacter sp.]MCM1434127.1 hypothetical protein [Clostridiales bacterium]